MGRDTNIYIFDKEIASSILHSDLKNQKLYKKTFEEFINERKIEIGNYYDISYQQILNIVKEDINIITADELFELIYYLNQELIYGKYYEKVKTNGNFQNIIYEGYGITLLYELKGNSSSYMFRYGDFVHHYPIEEIKLSEDDMGHNICVKDFLKFNDYVILLTKHIMDNRPELNYLNEKEKEILNQTYLKYKKDNEFINNVQDDFKFIMSQYKEDDDYNCPETYTVYGAGDLAWNSIEMKRKINPEINTRIVIVDSY